MDLKQPVTDPATVARYAESTPQKVPGYADLHRMTTVLLAEHAPEAANILVVGAGGDLELKARTEARPGWCFAGVDPSLEMLDLVRRILGPLQKRVELHRGYIDAAPTGPSDGATCLLTLHFLERGERLRVLREIRLRLKPGAPLILAHHSCPDGGEIRRWLSRSAAFASETNVDFAAAALPVSAMASRLPILSVDQDEAILRETGLSDVALFYVGFTFHGWVAAA